MGHTIIIGAANTAQQMKEVFEIRKKVFVIEQGVSEREEYDGYETSSTHLIATYNDIPAGTCRYRNTEKGIKLERFAILEEFRKHTIGSHLVHHCLNLLDKTQCIYLHAQIQVVDFYARFGFKVEGAIFDEAGIQHYKMVWKSE